MSKLNIKGLLVSLFSLLTVLSFSSSTLDYSTFIGGGSSDVPYSFTCDSAGNVYVVGYTNSTDYPTLGGYTASNAGSYDIFVTKLNPTGTGLVYSTYIGGSGTERAEGVAIDATGNAYITGYTDSTNFPTTLGAISTANKGASDAFVVKLNASGNALVYSTYIGGTGNDYARDITVDAAGNAYIIGNTASTNFPTTVGVVSTALSGTDDSFVTKINATGTAISYSTYLGGSNSDYARKVRVDTTGNAYIAGYTSSGNFPTTFGAYTTAMSGSSDGFITKLNTTGALVYSTYLGGTGDEYLRGLYLASDNSVYVTGQTASSNFPCTVNAYNSSLSGSSDAFVTRLNPSGNALVFSTLLRGTSDDNGQGVAVDTAGNIYLSGVTYSTDFPTTPGTFDFSPNGNSDTYVVKMNPTATDLIFSTYLGGSGVDAVKGISLDAAGNAYVAGQTASSDFPKTTGAYSGSNDIFVTRIGESSLVPVELGSFEVIE